MVSPRIRRTAVENPKLLTESELQHDIAKLKDDLGDIIEKNNGEELYILGFDAWEWGEKQAITPPPNQSPPPPTTTNARNLVFHHPVKELIWLMKLQL